MFCFSSVSQSLETSLSASIINIITNNVVATLPDGVVSSSAQIYITGTIGYEDIATDIEVAVISSSLSASQVLISSSISSSIATRYPNVTTDTVTTTDNIFTASINYTFDNSLTNIVIKGSATNINSNSTILRLTISSSTGTTEYDRVILNNGATARYTSFVLVASFNNISGPGFIQLNSIPTNATALSASLYNVRGLITKIPR